MLTTCKRLSLATAFIVVTLSGTSTHEKPTLTTEEFELIGRTHEKNPTPTPPIRCIPKILHRICTIPPVRTYICTCGNIGAHNFPADVGVINHGPKKSTVDE
jgi:hypothetical protein